MVSIFKEIQEQPERIFDMLRVEIKETIGLFLSKLMETELPHFLHGNGMDMVKETLIIA